MRLSEEAFEWLTEKLQAAFNKYGKITSSDIEKNQERGITLTIIKQIYPLAKSVYEKKLDIKTASRKLVEDAGMNPNSANDSVRGFLKMMAGKRYTRTCNEAATEYFLEMIEADFGQQYLKLALSSVEKHLEYFESKFSPLPGIRRIHRKFSNRVSGD